MHVSVQSLMCLRAHRGRGHCGGRYVACLGSSPTIRTGGRPLRSRDGTPAGPVGVQHFTEVARYCRALTAAQLHSLVPAQALTHSSAEHT